MHSGLDDQAKITKKRRIKVKQQTLFVPFMAVAMLAASCAPQPTASPQPTESTQPIATEAAAETASPAEPVELDVFAAASLTGAFEQIGELFEAAHPEASLVFNFAGSQQLAQQIIEGAPADVFASANPSQMDGVVDAGGIDAASPQTFVMNRLVVIYPKDNPAGLRALGDLAAPGLKTVFAAQEVPVGQYSLDFLDLAAADPAFGLAFKAQVLKNVVSYEDNVKAVLAKVALGEADAGIVYSSDLVGEDAGKVGKLDIPDELNVTASYPIAVLKECRQPELARAFVELVLSSQGQEVLANYGFIPSAGSVSGPFSVTDALDREVYSLSRDEPTSHLDLAA